VGPDAGPQVDGTSDESGCACDATGGAGALPWAAMLLLLRVRRRRPAARGIRQ
jgi:uncharacterized protein (TIGR03382 family)